MAQMLNGVTCGDCLDVMKDMPSQSIDFILTDPPYLVHYRDRSGRTVKNDNNDAWLDPAFAQMHRVLKDAQFCVSFYAWNKVDRFMAAWRKAGFKIAGHIVFTKRYASSEHFMRYQHEQAYLLAKGNPAAPRCPPPDVIRWTYTGNRLHPTQKPVGIFTPLIEAFTKPGVELDPAHHRTASLRLLRKEPLGFSVSFNQQAARAERSNDGKPTAVEPGRGNFHKTSDAPASAPAA